MEESIREKLHIPQDLLEAELKPFVKRIDEGSYYAKDFLKKIGKTDLLSSSTRSQVEALRIGMTLVEEISKVCMTTAFCLWCHLAALTYVRHTSNQPLKNKFLPLLESGEILAGTGLSNPMKYYAGLEKLHLKAQPVEEGVILSGTLPAVSNLGHDHWFGVIAKVDDDKEIMCFVPCYAEGLSLKEKLDYLGVNGSATYACTFHDVFVPTECILSENAAEFVKQIRPFFIAYQIPLGLGIVQESIDSIEKTSKRQNGCNRYLKKQANELQTQLQEIRQRLETILISEELNWQEFAELRLDTVYLTLEAVQASMLHHGSAGYMKDSAPSRRLREAYFFANLTPTVKHLEKVLQ